MQVDFYHKGEKIYGTQMPWHPQKGEYVEILSTNRRTFNTYRVVSILHRMDPKKYRCLVHLEEI